jgi:hypothetical protein
VDGRGVLVEEAEGVLEVGDACRLAACFFVFLFEG